MLRGGPDIVADNVEDLADRRRFKAELASVVLVLFRRSFVQNLGQPRLWG
jgi:hypothetical protein